MTIPYIEGILPKGPYLPCVSMAGRALLEGYHGYKEIGVKSMFECYWKLILFWCLNIQYYMFELLGYVISGKVLLCICFVSLSETLSLKTNEWWNVIFHVVKLISEYRSQHLCKIMYMGWDYYTYISLRCGSRIDWTNIDEDRNI